MEDSPEDGGVTESDGNAPVEAGPCLGAGDFSTDAKNCGGCGHKCSGSCSGGLCPIVTVQSGFTNPDSLAVDDFDNVFLSVLNACAGSTCPSGAVLSHLVLTTSFTAIDSGLGAGVSGIPVVTDGTNVYWASSAMSATAVPPSVWFKPLAAAGAITDISPNVSAGSTWVALAVDSAYLYVGGGGGSIYNAGTSKLGKSNWNPLPGNAMQAIAGLAAVSDFGHYMFCADQMNTGGGPVAGSITATVVESFTMSKALWNQTPTSAPVGIAASPYGVYWTDGAKVETRDLPAKNPSSVLPTPMGSLPLRIVADSKGTIYWTTHEPSGTGNVMMLFRGAKSPIIVAMEQANPTAIAISGSRVYWVNAGTHDINDGSVAYTSR